MDTNTIFASRWAPLAAAALWAWAPAAAQAQSACAPSLSLAITSEAQPGDTLVSNDGSIAVELVLRNLPDDVEITAKAMRGTSGAGTPVAGEATIIDDTTSRLLLFRPQGAMIDGRFTISASATLPDGSVVSDSLAFRVAPSAQEGDHVSLAGAQLVNVGQIAEGQNCCPIDETCAADPCGAMRCRSQQCWPGPRQNAQVLEAAWNTASFGRIAELYRSQDNGNDGDDELVARYVNWGSTLTTSVLFFGEVETRCVRLKIRQLLDDATVYDDVVCRDTVTAIGSTSPTLNPLDLALCTSEPDDPTDPTWLTFTGRGDDDLPPIVPQRVNSGCATASPSRPKPAALLLLACAAIALLRRRPR